MTAALLRSQPEALLYPALFSHTLRELILYAGLAGLGLGMISGAAMGGNPAAVRWLLPSTALVPALLLALLGILHPVSFSLCDLPSVAPGAPETIPFTFYMLLALLAMGLPGILGIGLRLRIDSAQGSRWPAAFLLSGSALGAIAAPLLLYQSLGIAATLQLMALAAGLPAMAAVRSGSLCWPVHAERSKDRTSLRDHVEGFLFGLGTVCILLLLQTLVSGRLGESFLHSGITVGFVLIGTSFMLALTALIAPFRCFAWPSLTLPAVALALQMPSTGITASLGGDLKTAAMLVLPFGLTAGFGPMGGWNRLLLKGLPGFWMGAGCALILSMTLAAPAGHPLPALVLGASALLLLEVMGSAGPRERPFSRVSVVRAGAGAALLAASLAMGGQARLYEEDGRIPDTFRRLDAYQDPAQEERAALITALFHPRPVQVLVLGGDPGSAFREIARDVLIKEVAWVSTDQDSNGEVKPYIGNIPEKAPADKITVMELPERLFARSTDRRFDLILLPPPASDRGALPPVFTAEFYGDAGKLLKKEGILCQWIPPHRLDRRTFIRLLATLRAAFEHLNVFVDHRRSQRPWIALVGSQGRLGISSPRTADRMKAAGCIQSFEEIGLGPGFLALNFLTTGEVLDVKLPPLPITDEGIALVFSRPASYRANLLENMQFLSAYQVPPRSGFLEETLRDLTPKERLKYAHYLQRVGGILQAATLDKIRRRVFDPRPDLKSPESVDLEEALLLARALGGMETYSYLEDLLLRKAVDLMEKGRIEDGIKLLQGCIKKEPDHAAFQRELDAALRLSEEREKKEPSRLNRPR